MFMRLPSFSIGRQVAQQLPAGGPQIRGHPAPCQLPESIQVHHLQHIATPVLSVLSQSMSCARQTC